MTRRRYVPSTVVIGERGPVVTRGYTQIGDVKIYDDQVVIGSHGQHVIDPGYAEVNGVEIHGWPTQR